MFAIKNPEKCSNCKLSPVTSVFDKKAGDLICTNCGAVLQHKIASVSSFSYKYGENDLVGCGETVKVSHLGFSFTTQHESQKKNDEDSGGVPGNLPIG